MDFETWLTTNGHKPATDAERAALRTQYEAQRVAPPAPPAPTNPPDPQAPAQTTRAPAAPAPGQETIRDVARAAAAEAIRDANAAEGVRREGIRALAGPDVSPDVIQRAIDGNMTVDQARAAVLEAVRKNRPTVQFAPAVIAHGGGATRAALEAAILMRDLDGQALHKAGHYDDATLAQADRMRGISLIDICRMALALDHVEAPLSRDEMIRAAFSTTSLPQLTGNVANRRILDGYAAAPNTFAPWTSVGSVQNFLTHTGVRLSNEGRLFPLGAGGEIKHGKVVEEYGTYAVATYAQQLIFTRVMIINDDTRGLSRVPSMMGAEALETVADVVYTLILDNGNQADGVALFATARGNLVTSNALADVTDLTAAELAFRKMKGKGGRHINTSFAHVVIPPDLAGIALDLATIRERVVTGLASTSALTTAAGLNRFAGKFAVNIEARLSDTAFHASASATSWYTAANPASQDTVEVVYLNGQRAPTLERITISDVLGIGWNVWIDVGAWAPDPRGLQMDTA